MCGGGGATRFDHNDRFCQRHFTRGRNKRARIANAYRNAGAQAVEGFRSVLFGIIAAEADRRRFERPTPAQR